MFNSQHVNNDPEPYLVDCGIVLGSFRQAEAGPSVEDYYDVTYEPRPKYDNNPNPILDAFREDTKPHAGSWLSCLEEPYRERVFGPQEWSREHINHARKVLEKLVNVYG